MVTSTHILAVGLSPSGLNLCHTYGFWAVSNTQASDKTLLPEITKNGRTWFTILNDYSKKKIQDFGCA